ncbi:MAG: ATP synthase F1 subunit delta [Myxococcota bacterium]
MSQDTIAMRYAKALFDLTVDHPDLGASELGARVESVEKELQSFQQTLQSSIELQSVFYNPAYGAEIRDAVLKSVADRLKLSTPVLRTLCLLSERRRIELLDRIAQAYRRIAELQAGTLRAVVTSAQPLSPSEYEAIRKELSASLPDRNVVLEKKLDPSLIAGVVTRLGDVIFDGSLKNQLQELKEELMA